MRLVIFALVVLNLFGCSHRVTEPSDGGPNRVVDVDAIPDTIAKPVVRTAAGNYSPYTVLGKTYAVMEDSRGYVAEGNASWYGSKFHGRNTSNGEVFDMYGLTAAHKHLPIPTYAEVTNLNNGQTITVRINDRGPFHSDRIIDLSWAAAAKLGFADQGTAPVRVVALDPDSGQAPRRQQTTPVSRQQPAPVGRPSPVLPAAQDPVPAPAALPQNSYYQVAAVSDRFGAARLARDIEALAKYPVAIEWDESSSSPIYKVLVGPLSDRRDVITLATILELGGLEPGFLIQLQRASSATDIGNM